jgi:hypothetical protein
MRFPGRAAAPYNGHFLRFYRCQLALTVTISLAGLAIAYVVVTALADSGALGRVGGLLQDDVTHSVFAWASAGYLLLAVGLLNATFLFSLARPWRPTVALIAAVVVDLAVGITLSRTGAPWHSAIGLAAGCGVFAAITGVMAVRTLRRTDYHLYAAF